MPLNLRVPFSILTFPGTLSRQRKNIEFHGGRKERDPARRRRRKFGRAYGAERRQADGGPL